MMTAAELFFELRNCHEGEGATAVALATGPSLADLTEADLARLCHGRVVFAVKQALLRYPGADYHILNPVHLQPYRYGRNTMVFSSNWAAHAPLPGVDFHFEKRGCGVKEDSLVITRDWDRSLLDTQFDRQWGPGIMFEMVIPLAIHFGIQRLIVVGWDLGPPEANFYRHAIEPPNPIELYSWETAATIDASADYYEWLRSLDFRLELLSGTSTKSYLSPAIPRITLTEAVQ